MAELTFGRTEKKKSGAKPREYDAEQVCALRIVAKWKPSDIAKEYKVSKSTIRKLTEDKIDIMDETINQSNKNR